MPSSDYSDSPKEARNQIAQELTKDYLEEAAFFNVKEKSRGIEIEGEIGRIAVENGSNLVSEHWSGGIV